MERTNVCVGAAMSAIRVCRERGCITNLSRFNPGTYCWEHTPDLTQTDRPAQHVRPKGQLSTQGIMSDAFLAGSRRHLHDHSGRTSALGEGRMSGTYLSLFSGIGGLDLAVEAHGYTCVGQVEYEPACVAVLERWWPGVPRWGDVHEFSAAGYAAGTRRGEGEREQGGEIWDAARGAEPERRHGEDGEFSAAAYADGWRSLGVGASAGRTNGDESRRDDALRLGDESLGDAADTQRDELRDEPGWRDGASGSGETESGSHDAPQPDLIIGGYPCQPFSAAGRRAGAEDPRHLWPEFARLIGEFRPRLVLLENVPGHLSLGASEVLADLAALGYDATWTTVRASDVGAPHRRERWFCLATDTSGLGRGVPGEGIDAPGGSGSNGEAAVLGGAGHAPDAGMVARPTRGERDGGSDAGEEQGARGQSREAQLRTAGRDRAVIADSEDTVGTISQGDAEGSGNRVRPELGGFDWGTYGSAIRGWERVMGPAPHPVDHKRRLEPAFVEWMMGFPPGWTEGLSRTQALKALGNAVVPQQGAEAIARLGGDRTQTTPARRVSQVG